MRDAVTVKGYAVAAAPSPTDHEVIWHIIDNIWGRRCELFPPVTVLYDHFSWDDEDESSFNLKSFLAMDWTMLKEVSEHVERARNMLMWTRFIDLVAGESIRYLTKSQLLSLEGVDFEIFVLARNKSIPFCPMIIQPCSGEPCVYATNQSAIKHIATLIAGDSRSELLLTKLGEIFHWNPLDRSSYDLEQFMGSVIDLGGSILRDDCKGLEPVLVGTLWYFAYFLLIEGKLQQLYSPVEWIGITSDDYLQFKAWRLSQKKPDGAKKVSDDWILRKSIDRITHPPSPSTPTVPIQDGCLLSFHSDSGIGEESSRYTSAQSDQSSIVGQESTQSDIVEPTSTQDECCEEPKVSRATATTLGVDKQCKAQEVKSVESTVSASSLKDESVLHNNDRELERSSIQVSEVLIDSDNPTQVKNGEPVIFTHTVLATLTWSMIMVMSLLFQIGKTTVLKSQVHCPYLRRFPKLSVN